MGKGKGLTRRIVIRALAVCIGFAFVSYIFTPPYVLAYVTAGANGASLDKYPGFTVNQLLAPAGSLCRSQQMLRSFTGVTIHETSNWSTGANAHMHALYLRDAGQNSEVSWHYSVDCTSAWQSIPESEKAWHAGDTGQGQGNASTIAIEICDNRDGNFDQAMANAEWLAADILYRHGVYTVTNHLFQHNQFSSFGKNCPITIRDTGRWGEFCTKTQAFLDQMVAAGGTYSYTDSNGIISISGTPADAASASRVDFYVDNYVSVASMPVVNGSFSGVIDSVLFTSGWHVFHMAIISNTGSVTWIHYSYLVGPQSATCLDSPSSSETEFGDISIYGWALSHAGMERVDFYVDNMVWLGSTASFYARSDVNAAINSLGRYKNGLYSGFSYTISDGTLSEGVHTLFVAAIGKDGSVQWIIRTFTVGPSAQLCVESPTTDVTDTGDITVSGWALSCSGMSRVDIYMDDFKWVGSTNTFYSREDVNAAVNSLKVYKNGQYSGFSYTIDASRLTVGTHTLYIAAISNNGSVQWTTRTMTVGPDAAMYLDLPQEKQYAGSQLTVSGWALNHAGISRVDFYYDNFTWAGSTADLYERADVTCAMNALGQYKDGASCGFSHVIDTSNMLPGEHTIYAAAIGKDGSVQWSSRTIVIPDPLLYIDSQTDNVSFDGDITLSGWTVSHAGVSRVDIYADDFSWVGSTNLSERQDVNAIINKDNLFSHALNSGFSYTIPDGRLTSGTHTIYFAAISYDGSVLWSSRVIQVT